MARTTTPNRSKKTRMNSTRQDAEDTLEHVGETIKSVLEDLVDQIHYLKQKRNEIHDAWSSGDYETLYHLDAISKREYDAAMAAIETLSG
jgi:hypothetical protein